MVKMKMKNLYPMQKGNLFKNVDSMGNFNPENFNNI